LGPFEMFSSVDLDCLRLFIFLINKIL